MNNNVDLDLLNRCTWRIGDRARNLNGLFQIFASKFPPEFWCIGVPTMNGIAWQPAVAEGGQGCARIRGITHKFQSLSE